MKAQKKRRLPGREASTTDLRQLSAAAAHEIRNPLNTMAIHCELLESRIARCGLPEREREALLRSVGTLTSEVQRIDKILEHFLLHAGPPEVDREQIDADAWIRETVAQGREEAQRRGVEIILSHPPLGRWHVDGVTLARALSAVLENAVLASPKGGQVKVEASRDDELARITVTDFGEGIAPDRLALVCNVGYTTRPGHAGLGLSIAKQVVKAQHGGDFQVKSAQGQGTSVIMDIPLQDEV